jgi:uridylate kinase
MAKSVDGVYDSDPKTNPAAKKFDQISYSEVLQKNLKVADATAISLCRDNSLPIHVFNLLEAGNISKAAAGIKMGTFISRENA